MVAVVYRFRMLLSLKQMSESPCNSKTFILGRRATDMVHRVLRVRVLVLLHRYVLLRTMVPYILDGWT